MPLRGSLRDEEKCGDGEPEPLLRGLTKAFRSSIRQDVTLRLLTRGPRVCVRVPVPGQVYVAGECELPPATEIICIARFSFR